MNITSLMYRSEGVRTRYGILLRGRGGTGRDAGSLLFSLSSSSSSSPASAPPKVDFDNSSPKLTSRKGICSIFSLISNFQTRSAGLDEKGRKNAKYETRKSWRKKIFRLRRPIFLNPSKIVFPRVPAPGTQFFQNMGLKKP